MTAWCKAATALQEDGDEADRSTSNPAPKRRFPLPIDDVLDYDNPEFRARLEDKFKLGGQAADNLFRDLNCFLWLCALHKDKAVRPPSKIDRAWHEFILYTADYRMFCQKYFGCFIHHQPDPYHYDLPKPDCDTLELAVNEFGRVRGNWGRGATKYAKCGT